MTIDGLSDSEIRDVLTRFRTFAVIGASAKPERPSYGVMGFLIAQGFQVTPVNPAIAGKTILDQSVYASLADVPSQVDVVDVFRSSDAVPQLVRDVIAQKERLSIKVIWMQLGVINEDAAAEARAAGLTVIMDRCPKIEFARLMRS